MGEPDQDIKPYHDNVWVLKRTGIGMLAVYVALAVGAVSLALGVSHKVVAVCLGVAVVLWFALTNSWFLQDRRREKRRRAAIRALRTREPIEAPTPVVKQSARRRMSNSPLVAGGVVISLGLPLLIIGAITDAVGVLALGLALTVLDLLLLAIVLPGLSASRHRRSRQSSSSGNPQRS